MAVESRAQEAIAGAASEAKIVAVETWRPALQPNVVFVLVHAEDGTVGLGDAFFGACAVETHIHDAIAPLLLAAPDALPERVSQLCAPYAGYQGAGVELRANGAIDIALWDLLGKRAGMPVVELFGGPVQDAIEVYNTCAGPSYVSTSSRQELSNWGLGATGDYEDLHAFLTHPGALAKELLSEGIRGMKIWPFDGAAEKTGGRDISASDLGRGIAIVSAIRDAVGEEMDVMVELHGLWSRRAATKICDALTPYRPSWVEDPIRSDAVDALSALRADVDVQLACGETCVGRRGFLPLLNRAAIDIVTVDVGWTGGLTEARKVASLADAFGVVVAPHDCSGPVSFAACVHLVLSQPNGLVQETVRSFLRTWYTECVVGLPEVIDGRIHRPTAPGLGVDLSESLRTSPDVSRRRTSRS